MSFPRFYRSTAPASAIFVLLAYTVSSFAAPAAAETVRGQVVDAETGSPIPYVNIGVPASRIGTVGGEDGRFVLDGVPADATILFSANLFESLAAPPGSLPEDLTIRLAPVGLGFREHVSVTAKAGGEPRIFGHRYSERGYGMGFGSGLLGSEIGARIRIDGPTLLEAAHFIVTHTGGERFLYRVNLYDFSGKEVGEKILREDAILEARQERGTLTLDLREFGLVVEDDVLLSLEWIRGDAEMGNENIMFRARPRTKSNVYLRPTSQLDLIPIKRHGLGFYLTGQPLPGDD